MMAAARSRIASLLMEVRGVVCRRGRWVSAWVALAVIASPGANAHPHAWIDVKVQVQFDPSAQVAALRMTWLFDAVYSAYISQGLTFNKADTIDAQQRDRILAVLMKNLARFHYLTRAWSGKAELEFKVPDDGAIRFRDRRLELTFTLPLTHPLAVRTAPFTYSVYDPSYYIEMLHAEDRDAIQLIHAPRDCRYALQPPHPDPAMVEKAAALDRTQSAGNGLGEFFAERVTVQCPG
jgi:ABC-type uncharacterized transport system substrate-binding protein